MEEDKPVNVRDMIRRFSSQSNLTSDNGHHAPQGLERRQVTLTMGNQPQIPQHPEMTQAQVATGVSASNQNISNTPLDEKKKKPPQIPEKPKLRRASLTANTSFGKKTKDPEVRNISKSTSELKESSRDSIKTKLVNMFDGLRKIIESKEYDEELKECLGKASPDYLAKILEIKSDILKSDHGIVITGETSAGKSTLVNKILGMKIFKGRHMESTSTVCKIRNSADVIIKTELETGEVTEVNMKGIDLKTDQGVKSLRRTLTKLTDMTIAESSKTYKCVDIGIPASFLKGNITIVDTPGIGGSGEVSHKMVEYLSNAASFIFVINVASAGGMQKDRLPEILRLIINMQMDDEKPWFDLSSVIFITNKWDNIEHDPDDSSDEEEVEKVWKKLTYSIERNWPSVRKENIFKMNLKNVHVKEKEKSSTVEFEKFLKTLEEMVEENEIIRITEHFRYLCALLEDVCTGIQTRQELINKTEDEQKWKREKHQRKIDVWKNTCKEKRESWRKRIETFIEKQAEESLSYMSSNIGKDRILNPNNWEPIMDLKYVPYSFSVDVQERIDHYVTEKVRSARVVGEFKNIKDEILSFYQNISSEIEKMEKEWTGIYDLRNSDKDVTNEEESIAPKVAGAIAISPQWFPLLAAEIAEAVAFVPLVAPFYAMLGRDSRRKKIIDEEYEKRKSLIADDVRCALKSNHGYAMDKLIDKLTVVHLVRRIQFIEETIKDLYDNREKILKNKQRSTNLAEKIKCLKDMAEEIKTSFKT